MHVPASMVLLALRVWWYVLAGAAVVGAALGLVAALQAPSSATSMLLVDTSSGGDSAAQSQILQTALQIVDTGAVYDDAATKLGASAGDLRAHTAIALVPSTDLLSVTVTDPSSDVAVREADAIADAASRVANGVGTDKFTTARNSGQQSIADGQLSDPLAENARRQAIGTTTAQRQDQGLRAQSLVTRLGGVQAPAKAGLSTSLGLVVGGLAGLLAGVVAALVLGVRRRRIKGVGDLASVPFELRTFGPDREEVGIIRTAALCAGLERPLAVVLALPGAEDDLEAVADDLARELRLNHMRCFTVEADSLLVSQRGRTSDHEGNGFHDLAGELRELDPISVHSEGGNLLSLTLTQRRAELAGVDADVLLATGNADLAVMNRLAGRAEIVLLVGRIGRTTVGEVAEAAEILASASPGIILKGIVVEEPTPATVDSPLTPPAP